MKHRSLWRWILLAAIALASMALLLGCPPPAGEPTDDGGDGGDDNPTWPVIMVYFVPNYYTQLWVDPGATTDVGTVLEGAERELTFVVTNHGW